GVPSRMLRSSGSDTPERHVRVMGESRILVYIRLRIRCIGFLSWRRRSLRPRIAVCLHDILNSIHHGAVFVYSCILWPDLPLATRRTEWQYQRLYARTWKHQGLAKLAWQSVLESRVSR